MSSKWSNRDQIKRRFKQADHAIETAQMYMLDCLGLYAQGDYPEHVALTDGILELMEICRTQVVSAEGKL